MVPFQNRVKISSTKMVPFQKSVKNPQQKWGVGAGGGGGARTFSMAHMIKSTLGGGWCKTQISKSTQGSFFVFRWGCEVSNGDFEKYQGTFFYEK